ncbi:bifunctional phosphopantothenoylcysteine decarboxylase/phosphopantothenate--cysteine ligase CoaBC [Cetobacterium sp. SF1]|uniref:bifunctional phosphopantothenoylcysteine decarboxylase/phosphopantothenate--cysteine ligase CoaBC n=1 Tax=Cetobacterium sp. SF1 TaxID=3417654 RepID=UPI003CEE5E00
MKNILIGVTGGIAAYKSANIISLLRKKGFNVKVIMTKSATNIITPQTLETLSKNRVVVDMWERGFQIDVEHISLADWADIILIAPATYNIVGKIANGIADDMLSTVIAAAYNKAKIVFALAMNTNMYENPILKLNIKKLKELNYDFIEADEGILACCDSGKGRLKNEEEIIQILESSYIKPETKNNFLLGKKLLITAGRTEESLDPIRYFSNHSSGKMGYSLAEAAANLGAEVYLISGPSNLIIPKNIKKFISVKSAQEMYNEVFKIYDNIDIGIACAAVADYRPKIVYEQKIKKDSDELNITLIKNPDILLKMGELKKKQILIGFAAETENLIENALKKLKKKNLDYIVANHASAMTKNNNTATIINKNNIQTNFNDISKNELAYHILNVLKGRI